MNHEENIADAELGAKSIKDLIESYNLIGGFMARNLYDASRVLTSMYNDPDATVILSFTANLVSTGLRGILRGIIERGFADVVITTAGTVDHDVAKSLGGVYFKGSFDIDDSVLLSKGIHRIGNVFVRREHYGPLVEKAVHSTLSRINRDEVGVRELLWLMADELDDSSIIKASKRSCAPIYIPGFVDGAFGTAILTYNEVQRARSGGRRVNVNVLKDEEEIMNIIYSSKRLGAVIIGGGISKHHTIWWSQFKGGLDYVVYLTTATEWDGSLSGARPKEAISWGKVKPEARSAFVLADATITVPILFNYIASEIGFRRRNMGVYPWSCQ
ncbi:deoxyhypusine synthase [Caldivirga sp. UBA161]|uniref:deoxyhypusine synthase n=1 Tax=Caldivirga sp. UBA161 TaxID=1915569 RepID=UPI0025BCB2ED|nr:deoxyhypusine synthase [Caldivirga sp. UBA161]